MSNATFTIDADQIRFTQPALSLGIGYRTLAQQCFHHTPPTPYEVEMAIATVEDHIESMPELLQTASQQVCADAYLQDIARRTGDEQTLSQLELERLFNRMADVVSGSPMKDGEFPDDTNFFSYLLIVRELSHHLKIQRIATA
ncbi:hypothetical protein ACLPHM_09630 [Paenalcaligenes sp. Me131]|uniref:hypothetical protein n=1 Tax=Paenalcaligenes sp. Me131 TaxID=3392636 RepID=UPI003D2A1972